MTYNGATTNLHSIWDTAIPEQYVGGYSLADAKSWAATLTTAIKTGTYKSAKASWASTADISDPVSSAMVWASDSNAYVCSTVLPNGVSAVEGVDLSGAYYKSAIPVVEEQIAKAGYRYVFIYLRSVQMFACELVLMMDVILDWLLGWI